jgi:hypothetical protein
MGTRPVTKHMSKSKVADFEIIKSFRPILFLIILDTHKKEKNKRRIVKYFFLVNPCNSFTLISLYFISSVSYFKAFHQ